MKDTNEKVKTPGFNVKVTLLAWFAMVGFDFFLHAGMLAPLYTRESLFLLPPQQAFNLIPVGYLSFLVLAILLVWLMLRLKVAGWKKGAIFGLQLGFLTWGSFILGLYSISTASPVLLMGWFLGQTVEMGIAGAVAGYGLSKLNLKRLSLIVIILAVLLFVAGIIWQNVANFI